MSCLGICISEGGGFEMKTSTTITIIICLTILIFTLIITYGIVINEIYENPYEQCLKSCNYSDKITCTKICTGEFKEIIEHVVDKLVPLVEDIIDLQKDKSCEVLK